MANWSTAISASDVSQAKKWNEYARTMDIIKEEAPGDDIEAKMTETSQSKPQDGQGGATEQNEGQHGQLQEVTPQEGQERERLHPSRNMLLLQALAPRVLSRMGMELDTNPITGADAFDPEMVLVVVPNRSNGAGQQSGHEVPVCPTGSPCLHLHSWGSE